MKEYAWSAAVLKRGWTCQLMFIKMSGSKVSLQSTALGREDQSALVRFFLSALLVRYRVLSQLPPNPPPSAAHTSHTVVYFILQLEHQTFPSSCALDHVSFIVSAVENQALWSNSWGESFCAHLFLSGDVDVHCVHVRIRNTSDNWVTQALGGPSHCNFQYHHHHWNACANCSH